MKIPLNDLNSENNFLKKEMENLFSEVIEKSNFIGGPELIEFEKEFANYCGKKYCVGVSSGSTALYVSLKCLGIGKGDEVILPVNTFIATATAVSLTGAKPIFVDVGEDCLIDVHKIKEKISNKTKALIPVHLYGNVCEMDLIKKLASDYNLKIIEDCAQAHGSKENGKRVPIYGTGCFSFYPSKNLGSIGDAGCIVTDNENLTRKIRSFINHGRSEKYLHSEEGFNFRLDNLKAGILKLKLDFLDDWLLKKNKLAENYNELGIDTPRKRDSVFHSYHLYVLKTRFRNELKKYLKDNDVIAGIHYPIPLHLQPAFEHLSYKEGDFPMAEKLSKKIISLPIYPLMENFKQVKIKKLIRNFFKNKQ